MSSTPTSTGRTAGRPGAASRAAGWVAPLCWIAVLLDGFDLVVVGTVIPTLRTPEEWALSGGGATAVITIGLVGMMIGALTIGTLTDLVGRRKALIGAVASFSLFTLLCAVAPNATVFGLLPNLPQLYARASKGSNPFPMPSGFDLPAGAEGASPPEEPRVTGMLKDGGVLEGGGGE